MSRLILEAYLKQTKQVNELDKILRDMESFNQCKYVGQEIEKAFQVINRWNEIDVKTMRKAIEEVMNGKEI